MLGEGSVMVCRIRTFSVVNKVDRGSVLEMVAAAFASLLAASFPSIPIVAVDPD